MLRESCEQTGRTIDLTSVAHGKPDNIDNGPELAALIQALTIDTTGPPTTARAALVAVAGEAAAERAVKRSTR